jgi:uncharacterized Zn-finger protein
MQFAPATNIEIIPDQLAPRVRKYLQEIAGQASPITYLALGKALQLLAPQVIHRLTEALERLMTEDAAGGHPFIAALVISRVRGGLPARGFFDCATRLGRFHGDATGPAASSFHREEIKAAVAFWASGNRQERKKKELVGGNEGIGHTNYAKLRNDNGVSEIRIGTKGFKCIGVSPPNDHPHIYLDMGEVNTILCPYCGTLFRYDAELSPGEVDPPDCSYLDTVQG